MPEVLCMIEAIPDQKRRRRLKSDEAEFEALLPS
jgi:hypothetical protein